MIQIGSASPTFHYVQPVLLHRYLVILIFMYWL